MKRLTFLTLLVGCANTQSGSTPTHSGTTCVAKEGYSLTPTDEKGRYPSSIPHGKVTTFKVCDGTEERVILVYGATVGSIDDNQDMFLTDGKGHILTANRIVTLVQSPPVKLGDLEVTGRCDVMWDGGCDAAPAAPAPAPAANPAPAAPATGTPLPNPS